MRARLACLLSLLTHNVDRYLIYQKLYLFWEFTRVKIGVSNIKVTVGKTFNYCDGGRRSVYLEDLDKLLFIVILLLT